ncbi:hypothetical protein JCM6882_005287 [Rhodosporidiobolus microsporus]
MSSTRLVPEQVLLLDSATLKAPLDHLRRIHKQTGKTYDYNLNPHSTFCKDLDALLAKAAAPTPSQSPSAADDALKSVDAMLTRMRGLKRKLTDLKQQSDKAVRVVQTRVEHLGALPDSIEDSQYAPWARKRLSHQLVDYMLRANPPLKETAKELAREEGIEDLVDGELWDDMAKVENGLEAKRLDEVLSWVGENRTALKKLKSPLEFTIHLQSYIELCRSRDLLGAMTYARKHLSPAAVAEMNGANEDGAGDVSATAAASGEPGTGSHMAELSKAMALLAYPPDTTCLVYQDLYSPARWSSLRTLFRSTFLSLHSLPSIPLLHMSLQAGLASLKTPICCPVPAGAPVAPASAYPLNKPLRTTITADGEIVLSSPAASSPIPTPSPTPAPGGTLPSLALSGSPSSSTSALAVPPTGTSTPTPTPSSSPGIHAPLSGRPSPHCPLCSSPLQTLGAEVPYSHHVNSTIVCGITGRVVEGDGGEGGQLVALVSRVTGEGRVYSKEGLALRASQHPEGKLVEPVTGEVFGWDELKKVFIS